MKQASKAAAVKLNVTNRAFVSMLSDEVAGKLKRFHMHDCMRASRCLMRPEDHGPTGVNPPIIPYAEMSRSRVYTGTRESGSYNHHSQITKFKGKYFFAWSNGVVHEEEKGQRILISSSKDAKSWSEPVCVVGDRNDPVIAHNAVAIRATKDTLYVIGKKEDTIRDAASTGMRRIDPQTQEIFLYASTEGKSWKRTYKFTDRIVWIFENPRATKEGVTMCVACLRDGAAILRWKTEDISTEFEVIPVPQPFGAVFPYGEGSWYQTDDGTIVVFWRDEGQSCRLWVNYSTDGGKSFSEPMISDIPDSMSRVYAGRLADGRFFICNNALPVLLNRMHLMLMASRDGYVFDGVRLLVDDPTSQRLVGMLKADGYQYPCCLPESDRLVIGYSVNKEDIEFGVVDLKNI